MSNLILPKDGPRVPPIKLSQMNPAVLSEYDKTVRTWGIPNNLIRTMGWHPGLATTEVDYANSFIFDDGSYTQVPLADSSGNSAQALFPVSGFIDRVTKELVINLVSLLNKSRYSITHHTVIAYGTLSQLLPGKTPVAKAELAEEMLLQLVDGNARASFSGARFKGKSLYSALQIQALQLAEKLQGDAHSVTDGEFENLRSALRAEAEKRIRSGVLAEGAKGRKSEFLDTYVNAMLVELSWCIVHFAGLLNKWFIVLKVMDESDVKQDGLDFVSHYNQVVPERIKARNNKILGPQGWG